MYNRQEFAFTSDLHGQLPTHPREEDKNTILLLAGDVTEHMEKGSALCTILRYLCDRFKYVVYTPGNHEYYKASILTMDAKVRARMADVPNFRLLQGAEFIDFGDVRVVGATLWSDTSENVWEIEGGMNDYRFIRTGYPKPGNSYLRPLKASDTTVLHREHVAKIESAVLAGEALGKTVIVMTHHAPSYKSVAKRFIGHPLNSAYVTDIKMKAWPDYWIHGHIHEHMCYEHEGCIVLANPMGYPGENTGYKALERIRI
jgi:predicted phosphohydrolase